VATDYNNYGENYGGELACLSPHEDIDDDDCVDIDINSDSEDKMRSSFPKNLSRVSRLAAGGPQARDTTGMTASQKEAIEREDKILGKKWTDAQLWQCSTQPCECVDQVGQSRTRVNVLHTDAVQRHNRPSGDQLA
jgi:hypothetical protein